jgi:hypothetical protein
MLYLGDENFRKSGEKLYPWFIGLHGSTPKRDLDLFLLEVGVADISSIIEDVSAHIFDRILYSQEIEAGADETLREFLHDCTAICYSRP